MFSAISLYTGAGGLDLGFEAAGFRTRVAVEMDDDCVRTLRANRDWPIMHRSIHQITSSEILRVAGLGVGEADILIGGPPCQPFSKCGYWVTGDAQRLDDSRATTVEAFLRVLRDTRPKAFLMENVAGLAFKGKDEALRLFGQAIRRINRDIGTSYSFELVGLNAADFGVPQLRERVFLIGSREGTHFGPLHPTHQPILRGAAAVQLDLDLALPPYRAAWDALWDLEDDDQSLALRGKWADLLPSIPEGQNYLHHTARGAGLPLFGWRRRFWNFLLKLAKDQPSWTLTAQPGPATGPFHWNNRRLSARELCRLQTIPDDFHVQGSLGSVQRQIGNAVPSALAEVIGIALRSRLLSDRRARRSHPMLIPHRQPHIPPPGIVMPVPSKYLHLAGNHSAHPGTGKGNRATLRGTAA